MSRARGPLAALLALVVAWVLTFARPALAEPTAALPPDMPLTVQPTLTVPAVPEGTVVEEHGWLRFAYPKGTEERVRPVIDEADAIKGSLSDALGQPVLDHVEVRITRTPSDMIDVAPVGLPPPAYAVGVTYPAARLVIVSLVDPQSHEGTDVPEVLRHELAHMALSDATLGHHVPLWFNEGLAIHLSGEHALARQQMLGQASLSRSLLPLAELDAHFPRDRVEVGVAYAESADFVRFLLRHEDEQRFQALVSRVREGEAFERALGDAYGSDMRKLEFEWREGLSKRFSIWPVLASGSVMWLSIAALAWGWVRKRRRAKATLDRWEREEEAERAFAAAALAAQAKAEEPAEPAFDPAEKVGIPVVHHDGHWHTLH